MKILDQVVDIVGELNDLFYECAPQGISTRPFRILADGKSICVEFMGFQVWDVESDGDEEVRDYIIREALKILASVKEVDLEGALSATRPL